MTLSTSLNSTTAPGFPRVSVPSSKKGRLRPSPPSKINITNEAKWPSQNNLRVKDSVRCFPVENREPPALNIKVADIFSSFFFNFSYSFSRQARKQRKKMHGNAKEDQLYLKGNFDQTSLICEACKRLRLSSVTLFMACAIYHSFHQRTKGSDLQRRFKDIDVSLEAAHKSILQCETSICHLDVFKIKPINAPTAAESFSRPRGKTVNRGPLRAKRAENFFRLPPLDWLKMHLRAPLSPLSAGLNAPFHTCTHSFLWSIKACCI